MDKPLISVIVPVYNIMEYLPRCVESLSAQSYSNIEIILVDDGSTDGTGALCDRLAEQDERIKVFHKDNGGSSSARNLGISKARGEYFGFVDSDDFVEDDMYELLYGAIEQYGVKAAQIGRDELDAEKKRLPDVCVPPREPECIEAEAFFRELLMHRGDCSFCTKLIDRHMFDGERFPEGVLNEDFHLLVNLLPKIKRIVSLPKQTYHVFYRGNSNTRSKTGFSRVFADNIDNADMVYGMVEKDYPHLLEIAFRFGVFQRLDYMLHIPVQQMTKENLFYRRVSAYLRKNWWRGMKNPYLTLKNKCYHTLFAVAPRAVRMLHKKLRGL